MRLAADRYLTLLHRLEQRALHLRRRAVDLVGEKEVGEDRPQPGPEGLLRGDVDHGAVEVRRQQIGRELNPLERRVDRVGQRLHGEGLCQPGDALDQEMPAAQHAHEQSVDEIVLTNDHPVDLVQDRRDEIAAPEYRLVRHGRTKRGRHLSTD